MTFIGGIPFKTLQKIFIDIVKDSNPAVSNENNDETGSEIDRYIIWKIEELQYKIIGHTQIGQLLKTAQAAADSGNLNWAVLNHMAVMKW